MGRGEGVVVETGGPGPAATETAACKRWVCSFCGLRGGGGGGGQSAHSWGQIDGPWVT